MCEGICYLYDARYSMRDTLQCTEVNKLIRMIYVMCGTHCILVREMSVAMQGISHSVILSHVGGCQKKQQGAREHQQ